MLKWLIAWVGVKEAAFMSILQNILKELKYRNPYSNNANH